MPFTRSSWFLGILLLPIVPLLLFSRHVPGWVPVLALGWLGGLFAWGAWRSRRWLGYTPADGVILLMLGALLLGVWASPQKQETLAHVYAFMANVVAFYGVILLGRHLSRRQMGWLLLALGVFVPLVILPGIQISSEKLAWIPQGVYGNLPLYRLPGDENGFNPNMAASVIAPFIPVALTLALWPQARGQWVVAGVALLILVSGLALTQSRGALLGVFVAVIVVSVLASRAWRWLWWGVGMVLIGILVVRGSMVLAFVLNSHETFGKNSLLGRVEIWSRALHMGNDFAFSGVGLGMFQPVEAALYPTYVHVVASPDIPHPHNMYLWALAEMGYPGLIAWLAFFMILAMVLLRGHRLLGRRADRRLALGLLGGLLVILVHGLIDTPFYSPLTALGLWTLFGFMMVVGLSASMEEEEV